MLPGSISQYHWFNLICSALTQPWLKGYSGQFGAQTNHNELLSFYLAAVLELTGILKKLRGTLGDGSLEITKKRVSSQTPFFCCI